MEINVLELSLDVLTNAVSNKGIFYKAELPSCCN